MKQTACYLLRFKLDDQIKNFSLKNWVLLLEETAFGDN